MQNIFRRHPRARALAAVVALASTQACFAYKPLAGAAPVVHERVRVELTPQGSIELARYLGPNVAVAEGQLASIGSDDALVVAVDYVQLMNGSRQPWTGEGVVTIPAAYRAGLSQRVFLKGQSIAAGAALTAALVGIAVIALRAGGSRGGGDGGTPPPP